MFKAYCISQEHRKFWSPVDVYQILKNDSCPSGYEAIFYDFENGKWTSTDLNNINPKNNKEE